MRPLALPLVVSAAFLVGCGCLGWWGDDDAPADTGQATSPTPSEWTPQYEDLALWPQDLTVSPGSSWSMRVVGTRGDGTQAVLEATYGSEDESVVSINGLGTATSVGAGSTVVSAWADDLEASATVTVTDSGLMEVQLISAETAQPIPDAVVSVDGVEGTTDGAGWASVEVADGRAVEVLAWDPLGEHITTHVLDVVPRQWVLPLEPSERLDAMASGDINLDGVPQAKLGQRRVGIVGPRLRKGPLLVSLDELFGPTRSVELLGFDVELPQNLWVAGDAEDYAADLPAGESGLWTLGGPVSLADVAAAGDDLGRLVAVFVDHADNLVYDLQDVQTAEDADIDVGLDPAQPFDDAVVVPLPEVPAGFVEQDALVFVMAGTGDAGPAVVGLGMGSDEATALRVSADALGMHGAGRVSALVQRDGLGGGGSLSVSSGPIVAGEASLRPYLSEVGLTDFDGSTRSFTLNADGRATVTRLRVTSSNGQARIVWTRGGYQAVTLAAGGTDMGWGATTWDVDALETLDGTWESLLVDGWLTDLALRDAAVAAARSKVSF